MSEEKHLADAIAHCREDEVMQLLREQLAGDVPATEILAQCNAGMVELGSRFSRDECFIPDLMFGGMIMKKVMAELGPKLEESAVSEATGSRATAVIGTVQHDVHDIGKDIVIMMLRGSGFEVIDLGIDTPPEEFVQAIREHSPQILGMSLLLTTSYKSVAATMEAIQQAGLREGLSIMVGGAAASQMLAENAGCDYYGKTAVDGLNFACQVAGMG